MTIEELYAIYKQYPSVQTDTRKLKKGDIFFALKGPISMAMYLRNRHLKPEQHMQWLMKRNLTAAIRPSLLIDVLTTLQELAKYHRQQFNIPFIAITGSNGKTTTKELCTCSSFQPV